MRNHLILFSSAFLQLFLVAYNTWQIANNKPIQVAVVGFLIAFIWTFNVKRCSVSVDNENILRYLDFNEVDILEIKSEIENLNYTRIVLLNN